MCFPRNCATITQLNLPELALPRLAENVILRNADHSVKAMFYHKVKHVQIVPEAVLHMFQMTCCLAEHVFDMLKVVPGSIELTFCSIV